jgi:pimeloyl-ACP methyl ester carboxylesterase
MMRYFLLLVLSLIGMAAEAKNWIAQACINQESLLIHIDPHGNPVYVQGNGVMNRALHNKHGWQIKTLPEGQLMNLEVRNGNAHLNGKALIRYEPADDNSVSVEAIGEWRNHNGDALVIFKHPSGFAIGNREWETSLTTLGPQQWLLGDGRIARWQNQQLQISSSSCSQTANISSYRFHRAWLAEEQLITLDNARIGLQIFSPDTEPRGNVILVHGSAPFEAAWYQLQAWWFVNAGYRAIAFDKRGAGASSGNSFTSSVHDFAADVQQIIKYLRNRYPTQPVGLWGISQGGAVISLTDSKDPQLKPDFAIVVSTPGYAFRQQELYRRTQVYSDLGYSEAYATMGNRWWTMAFDMVIQISAGAFPEVGVRDYLDMNTDWSATWGKVSFPALLLFGKKDTLVEPGRAAAAIATARQHNNLTPLSMMTFANANHGMKLTHSGSFFEDNDHYVPDYVNRMTHWLDNHVNNTQENNINVVMEDRLQTRFTTGAEWGRPGFYAGIWGQAIWSLLLLLFIVVQIYFSIRYKSLLLFLASGTALGSIVCFNLLITTSLLPQLQIPDQTEPINFLIAMRIIATASIVLILSVISIEMFKAYSIQRKVRLYCWFVSIFLCLFSTWLVYWRIIL